MCEIGHFRHFHTASPMRSALSTLHPKCAAWTLDHTCPPPFDMGTMWSRDLDLSSGHGTSGSIGSWQIPQIQPSRSKTLIGLIGSYATPYFRARLRWFFPSRSSSFLRRLRHRSLQKRCPLDPYGRSNTSPHWTHGLLGNATDRTLLAHLLEHSTEHVRPRLLPLVTNDLPHSRQ